MKIVTYNIQYGIGLDGRYDLERTVEAVRGADVIALQEVTRNSPRNGGVDMVAGIKALLPDYFSVFGAPFSTDMGSRMEKAGAVDRRFEFGNMVLSKMPILTSRNILLPRMRTYDRLNLQRGALEAMIVTPIGPVRFYCLHLDHTGPDERIAQLKFLMSRVLGYAVEGGAVSGVGELGFPEPPYPEAFVLLGDFNMDPDSPEYLSFAGRPDPDYGRPLRAAHPVDAATLAGDALQTVTWLDPQRLDDPARPRRLDYAFVGAGLAGSVRSLHVDETAVGSDHRPVWLELG